jgi:hypothetical protein
MEQEETRSIICEHVFNRSRPVLYIAFFHDGEIMCDCDDPMHNEKGRMLEGFVVVGLHHLVEHDETLKSLGTIDKGYCYTRKYIGDSWEKHILPDEAD